MFAGIDGCKGGWIVAKAQQWPFDDSAQFFICRDFRTLASLTEDCEVVMVDMPIGLPHPSIQLNWQRQCDIDAQAILGRIAGKSVFPAPPRSSLIAENPTDFQRLHRQLTGEGAKLPVWGIVPKIREVDWVITPFLQSRIREFHPELAWWRLNGNANLDTKHAVSGKRQRRELLLSTLESRTLDATERWRGRLGRAAALDDLYDALVGLKVAASVSEALSIPASPQRDERGLLMEMSY